MDDGEFKSETHKKSRTTVSGDEVNRHEAAGETEFIFPFIKCFFNVTLIRVLSLSFSLSLSLSLSLSREILDEKDSTLLFERLVSRSSSCENVSFSSVSSLLLTTRRF